MQNIETKSYSYCHKAGSRRFLTEERPQWRGPCCINLSVTALNSLFILAFLIQMQHSGADTKQLILIDSTFSQPSRLQLRFWPMGKYAASTYTSHICIPLNYSSLMYLQKKINARLDNFFDDLRNWNFHISNETEATYKSIFQLYKQNTNEIYKLFNDLLASLPHVHE